jgi:hypothetical protein
MILEFAREIQKVAGFIRTGCPIDQRSVLVKIGDLAQPLRPRLRAHDHHIREIAGANAAADRELNTLQQAAFTPFRLQPFYWYRRPILLRRPAATTLANSHLANHSTFCFQHLPVPIDFDI